MKNIAIIMTVVISLFAFAKADAQKSNLDQFEVQVDGLGCPFCAYGLEKKFKEFKGIKDVKIDIKTGDFSFKYPSDKALSMQAVQDQVVKAGYTPNVSKITRANGKIETSQGKKEEKLGALTSAKLKVYGACGMCKARIEKAMNDMAGVDNAVWDVDSKMLSISYDKSKVSMNAINKQAAAVGHDTDAVKADKSTYNNLPGCCKYRD
ncbi:MAG: cation transporter [Nonlabens sp.]|nr:cation transporter [Nonlabens sp.]MDP5101899.1 cation transporter [Nonlabens sp.]